MPLKFETLIERELFIAGAIYHDDMTYAEVGKLVGVSANRIGQIYARFVRRCETFRRFRAQGRYLRRDMRIGYDMLDVAWIPIDKALAEYNISKKCIEHQKGWDIGHWALECRYTFGDDLRQSMYKSRTHSIGMMRMTVGGDGIEYWECNKHFFEKSLERPELQKSRNGIFTAIPKQPASKEK